MIRRIVSILLAFRGLLSAAQTCESLATFARPATTITLAESVPAAADRPAHCRVLGVIKPSGDSSIQFEIWMPSAGWNGKFQGVGNGGYAGSINHPDMSAALTSGYATASTDTGHQGGGTDAGWALSHPDKIVDFGHRAIHEMTVTAKAVTRAFYGEMPRRSYFNSCSNGGRQALMEAQRYPEDYDGIVAGAPANYWTHLLTNAVWDSVATLADKAAYISSKKLPAIEAAALAACDSNDGVKDGVIEDPSHCHFDPSVLQCREAETDRCLTAPQLSALKILYAGSAKFPGYAPGGEAEPGGWAAWITGAAPEQSLMYAFGTQFFKNMVFDNAAWDYHTYNIDRDTRAADDKLAPILNATNPDLSRFKARGGKLIVYHGWSDAAIPASNALDYYRSVSAKMGAKQTAQFFRLFMVPGMQHCGGGPGPNDFGQSGPARGDADHNIGAALERWVDQGTPPEKIIATKRKDDRNPKGELVRTRPLCAYPLMARYKGQGSTDDAANFDCAKSAKPL